MSFGRTQAMALIGLEGRLVEVEAHLFNGLPQFQIGGTVDGSVREARGRVVAACAGIGIDLNQRKLTVSLTPAALPKRGPSFDMAIAVTVLAALGVLDSGSAASALHVGELGLDGRVRPVPGVLPIVHAAARAGLRRVIVPAGNLAEACLTGGVDVIGAVSLADVVRLHGGRLIDEPPDIEPHLMPCPGGHSVAVPDLADVVGQDEARRALEVAAAGGHHLLLQGPPGAGKTMLAARLPGILPPLDDDEAVEVSAVHSISGTFDPLAGLTRRPPFEAPHHSATAAAIIGGGSGIALPGAMSRAHRGVLFLDEAPEFNRAVLESLRQPLEDGQVRIARAYGCVTYPARFQLVLAANPCPCGNFVGQGTACRCTPMQRRGYFAKLSGPVLDRIDVRVEVPAARLSAIDAAPEPSAVVAARVAAARAAQAERLVGCGVRLNGHLGGGDLRGRWRPARSATARLERALDRGEISLRGYDRVLRIGWTICDLRGGQSPSAADLTGALLLREPRLAA